jgi:hypothetical protein
MNRPEITAVKVPEPCVAIRNRARGVAGQAQSSPVEVAFVTVTDGYQVEPDTPWSKTIDDTDVEAEVTWIRIADQVDVSIPVVGVEG